MGIFDFLKKPKVDQAEGTFDPGLSEDDGSEDLNKEEGNVPDQAMDQNISDGSNQTEETTTEPGPGLSDSSDNQ